jgi:hypothetical protein
VHARLDQPRSPVSRPRRPATASEQTSIPIRRRPSDDGRPPKPAPSAATADEPLRDRGVSLMTIFTGAMLLIVALVCLVAGVDRWWILIPVMAIDLAVTGAVLAVMARLLDDGSS